MKSETSIKLYVAYKKDNGTIGLQSQLYVGKDTVDFILEDNVLKNWCWKPMLGYGFHETDIPYEIINNVNDMKTQML